MKNKKLLREWQIKSCIPYDEGAVRESEEE